MSVENEGINNPAATPASTANSVLDACAEEEQLPPTHPVKSTINLLGEALSCFVTSNRYTTNLDFSQILPTLHSSKDQSQSHIRLIRDDPASLP